MASINFQVSIEATDKQRLTGLENVPEGKLFQNSMSKAEMKSELLSEAEIDRVIQMAWEDRTSFDAIKIQFGLSPGDVIKIMRRELKPASFRTWRKRTSGRKTKHVQLRGFSVGRFRCPTQRS